MTVADTAMPDEFNLKSDEEIEAILRIAIRQSSTSDKTLRDRLQATADELGISQEDLAAAEAEYRRQHQKQSVETAEAESYEHDLKLYKRRRHKEFLEHLTTYVAVNGFLIFIDVMRDRMIDWAYWPILAWGVGLVIHFGTVLFGSSEDDEEFLKWRKKRQQRLKKLKQ